jgi:hypothetical protein
MGNDKRQPKITRGLHSTHAPVTRLLLLRADQLFKNKFDLDSDCRMIVVTRATKQTRKEVGRHQP